MSDATDITSITSSLHNDVCLQIEALIYGFNIYLHDVIAYNKHMFNIIIPYFKWILYIKILILYNHTNF